MWASESLPTFWSGFFQISNVFVRGISRDMSDTELHLAFGGIADGVVQCHVADGYGFVLFDTRGNAQKKIAEMDGKVLNGKKISVTWARPDTGGRKRKRAGEERYGFREWRNGWKKTPSVIQSSSFTPYNLMNQNFPSHSYFQPFTFDGPHVVVSSKASLALLPNVSNRSIPCLAAPSPTSPTQLSFSFPPKPPLHCSKCSRSTRFVTVFELFGLISNESRELSNNWYLLAFSTQSVSIFCLASASKNVRNP